MGNILLLMREKAMFEWLKKLLPYDLRKEESLAPGARPEDCEVIHAPCKAKGRHTSYYVLFQKDHFVTFPSDNYLLTTDEHRDFIKKKCLETGYPLREP